MTMHAGARDHKFESCQFTPQTASYFSVSGRAAGRHGLIQAMIQAKGLKVQDCVLTLMTPGPTEKKGDKLLKAHTFILNSSKGHKG